MSDTKKIGLVTLFWENYGSILQCFSTKSFIEKLGVECNPLYLDLQYQCFFSKLIRKLRFLLHPRLLVLRLKERRGTVKTLSKQSESWMNLFVETFLNPRFVREEELLDLQHQYDYFIVGSDQVWNIDYFIDPFRFLKFAPRDKRIALAASFGVSEIPQYYQNQLHKLLDGFNRISVREESGLEIVRKFSKTKVCRIADPTFIYNANEWRDFAKEAVVPEQKYILVHFLNEPNEIALESMNWLSRRLNMDVIAVGYNYEVFGRLKRFIFMDGGPWEYVSMIDKAEYVLTDSFHSSLFSINFNKRFFSFHRNYSASKQTSRISNLLKRFGMEYRLISCFESLKKYYLLNQPVMTRCVLEKERAMIRDFIQRSISDEIPQSFLQGVYDA